MNWSEGKESTHELPISGMKGGSSLDIPEIVKVVRNYPWIAVSLNTEKWIQQLGWNGGNSFFF